MQQTCVQCHNGHPDSVKKDWAEGEVGGVLEIIRPLDGDVARARAGLRGTFVLMAAISALDALTKPARVDLHTDSEYVKNGISTWIKGWKRNDWRTSTKEPVKNAELWQRLDAARARHEVHWHWVRGHAGHIENERADELAREGMRPFLRKRG